MNSFMNLMNFQKKFMNCLMNFCSWVQFINRFMNFTRIHEVHEVHEPHEFSRRFMNFVKVHEFHFFFQKFLCDSSWTFSWTFTKKSSWESSWTFSWTIFSESSWESSWTQFVFNSIFATTHLWTWSQYTSSKSFIKHSIGSFNQFSIQQIVPSHVVVISTFYWSHLHLNCIETSVQSTIFISFYTCHYQPASNSVHDRLLSYNFTNSSLSHPINFQ